VGANDATGEVSPSERYLVHLKAEVGIQIVLKNQAEGAAVVEVARASGPAQRRGGDDRGRSGHGMSRYDRGPRPLWTALSAAFVLLGGCFDGDLPEGAAIACAEDGSCPPPSGAATPAGSASPTTTSHRRRPPT
jgi:hypothetical protein